MALFLDIYPISEAASNEAIEYLFKSTHDHDLGIWTPHESPFIRRLIELFTQRGLDRLDHVRAQILAWQAGDHFKPAPRPAPPGMMQRWTPDELALVKIYLEAVHPSEWSLDDNMMSVDYVVQRYLPADELRTEAEWLAARAGMMGKVQANMAAEPTSAQADKILAALPTTVAGAAEQFHLNPLHQRVLDYGRARAAENVRAITEQVRHSLRSTILQHISEQETSPGGPSLQTKLQDKFADLNRDWRRIAVTEAGECHLQGYIASLKHGTMVKRVEQYANACGFCRKIDQKIAEVVSPDAPDKDPDNEIWVGKTNIGRSASPRKRVGNTLIDRTPEEMWWLPAGVAHPHCRGRWVPTIEDEPGDDKEFGDWLRSALS
jgi:hypothetical protein